MRVRGLLGRPGVPDEISATVNVSRNGILFITTDAGFHRGMDVAVTFPYTKVPFFPQLERPGTVVRVSALSQGAIAVAVAFCWETGTEVVPSPQDTEAATPTQRVVQKAADSRKPLVLAVEVEASVRDPLKTFLSEQGYEVIAVANTADAREVLNMLTPSLLIAEIEGEGLPGFELCAHVKSTPRLKHIPVILTTQSGYPSDYSNAHSLGAIVCMSKPYRLERLGHVARLLVPPQGTAVPDHPPRPPDPTRRPRGPFSERGGTTGRMRLRD